MAEWKKSLENYTLKGDGFWISYNPDPSAGFLGTFLGSDHDGPETALCYGGRFDILNGDFREEYEQIITKGLDACKAFYQEKSREYDSSWTTPGES